MVQFLVLAGLFWITLGTAYISATTASPCRAITRLSLARYHTLITRAKLARLICRIHDLAVLNLGPFKHTAYAKKNRFNHIASEMLLNSLISIRTHSARKIFGRTVTLKATVCVNAIGRRMTTVRIVIALVDIETATITCLIARFAFAVVPARQIDAIGRCVAGMQTGSTFVQIFLASYTNITISTGAYTRRQAQPAVQTWLLTNSWQKY